MCLRLSFDRAVEEKSLREGRARVEQEPKFLMDQVEQSHLLSGTAPFQTVV